MKPLKHFFKRDLCVDNIYIDDEENELLPTLKCKECGREIGFVYSDINEWKAFLHVSYRRFRPKIERWVREHTKNRYYMGNSFGQQWGEMLHNIKQWGEDNVFSMGCSEWDGECEEDSESDESDRIGETHQDGLEEGENMIEVNCSKCENCDAENDQCNIYGKDPSVAVNKCAGNGFSDYSPKQ